MRKEDIRIGMQVVPTQKTKGCSLNNSPRWKMAVRLNQPFLYVVDFSDKFSDCVMLAEERLSKKGDYFRFNDFVPYKQATSQKLTDKVREIVSDDLSGKEINILCNLSNYIKVQEVLLKLGCSWPGSTSVKIVTDIVALAVDNKRISYWGHDLTGVKADSRRKLLTYEEFMCRYGNSGTITPRVSSTNNQKSKNYDKRSFKLRRKTFTIQRGKRLTGSSVQGKTGKITVTVGHFGH